MLLRTIIGKKSNIVISPKLISRNLSKAGFTIKYIGQEGSINNVNVNNLLPEKYPKNYLGMPMITEIVAIRN